MCMHMFIFIQGNSQRREIKEEKRAVRAALIPLLQAEEDLRYVNDKAKLEHEDASLPKGFINSLAIYNGERWTPDIRVLQSRKD